MKIAVVSLNPAVDLTVQVDRFTPNQVNRASQIRQCPGGKGVNLASFLSDLGLKVAITGFLGMENSLIFEKLFAEKQIEDDLIRIPGSTRLGIKISDPVGGQTTDINLPGLAPTQLEFQRMMDTYHILVKECDWIILTGSLPPGLPIEIYVNLIRIAHQENRKTILDTSGQPFSCAVLAGPWMIKPNINELREWKNIHHPVDLQGFALDCAKEIFSYGTRIVVLSLGEKGAAYLSKEFAFQVLPPVVQPFSTVGAGDAMVAGLVASQAYGMSPKEGMRLATACSLKIITSTDRNLPGISPLLDLFAAQIKITDIKY